MKKETKTKEERRAEREQRLDAARAEMAVKAAKRKARRDQFKAEMEELKVEHEHAKSMANISRLNKSLANCISVAAREQEIYTKKERIKAEKAMTAEEVIIDEIPVGEVLEGSYKEVV